MKRHLEKFVPCDSVCRVCGEALNNYDQWKWHMKQEHLEEWQAKSQVEVEVDDILREHAHASRIPIEDFQWQNATVENGTPLEDFEVKIRTIKEITLTVGGEEIVVQAETVQKIKTRVKRIRNSFDTEMIQQAMRTIAPYTDVDQAAFQVLSMAIQPRRANQLANILLSDQARRSIRCLSRPDVDSDDCQWVSRPKNEGRLTIQRHLKNLLPMLIAEGCQKLEARMWKGDPVMALIGKKHKRWIVFFCNMETDELEYSYAEPDDIASCPDKVMITAVISGIKTLVQKHKDRVIKLIKQYQMQPSDVDMYLDMTKRVVV